MHQNSRSFCKRCWRNPIKWLHYEQDEPEKGPDLALSEPSSEDEGPEATEPTFDDLLPAQVDGPALAALQEQLEHEVSITEVPERCLHQLFHGCTGG